MSFCLILKSRSTSCTGNFLNICVQWEAEVDTPQCIMGPFFANKPACAFNNGLKETLTMIEDCST